MIPDPHRDGPLLHAGRPLKGASGAVVLVHGRGGSASDILGLAREMYHPELAYLAPEAAGNSWYPYSFLAPLTQNEPWLTSALNRLGSVIEQVSKEGIATRKTAIAGFSQGACLATEFVARHPARYGGLIAFTGGLIGPEGSTFQHTGALEGMRAFLGSGDPDPHVPWKRVQDSAEVLSRMGADVLLRRYAGMPHTISEEEIDLAKPIVMNLLD